MSDIDNEEMQDAIARQKERKEVLELMEGYAKNPSNSNKYYQSMLALIEERIERIVNEARIDELLEQKRLLKDIINGYANNLSNHSLYIRKAIRVDEKLNQLASKDKQK